MKGEAEDGQLLEPRALNAKMEKQKGIVSVQLNVECLNNDGDSLSSGDSSCASIDLDDGENSYCSADYRAPDDEYM